MTNRLSIRMWGPLPVEVVQEAFSYEPETGLIRWKSTGKGRHAKKNGVVGFKKGGSEYLAVKHQGKRLMLHRLAWCLHHGYWPDVFIDHLNGNPADNRLVNLRLADNKINAENQRRARSDNKTGFLGAQSCGKKYKAQIRTGGVTHYLGMFETPEAAHLEYVKAKRVLHAGNTL